MMGSNRARALITSAFVAFASASLAVQALEPEAKPALPKNALPVPTVSQATSYSCGAAAAASVFYYWQVYDGPEMDLHAELDTTEKDGTHPAKIAESARHRGLQAQVLQHLTLDDLRAHLLAGDTVILDIQAWPEGVQGQIAWDDLWDDGHYVVLVGMDDHNAYVMDPSVRTGYGYIPLSELPHRWHDWEDRYGQVEINIHLGIVVRGTDPLGGFPFLLTRVE